MGGARWRVGVRDAVTSRSLTLALPLDEGEGTVFDDG